VPDHDAILAGQRNDVGDGGHGHQIEQVIRQVDRQSQRRNQRLHQLESDTGAAELLQVGLIVGTLWIDDGDGRRKLGTGQVMVGDDDINPCGSCLLYRGNRRDAAIAGNDETDAGLPRSGDTGRPQVVTIPQAMGKERKHVCACCAKDPGEHRGSALTIHVVVAVDHDAGAGADRLGDPGDGLIHPGQSVRIGEFLQGGTEESSRGDFAIDTPLHQECGEGNRQP
jgi:hypothetical protein